MFIHGLGGDSFGTWRDGTDDANLWPRWLGEEFPDVGVWSLGYAASLSRFARIFSRFLKLGRDAGHSMALPDRAVQVLDLIDSGGFFVDWLAGNRPARLTCLLLRQKKVSKEKATLLSASLRYATGSLRYSL